MKLSYIQPLLIITIVICIQTGCSNRDKREPRPQITSVPSYTSKVSSARNVSSLNMTTALDVAEASFRFLFTRSPSSKLGDADYYCLYLFGKDPQQSFLNRFANENAVVTVGSRFPGGIKKIDLSKPNDSSKLKGCCVKFSVNKPKFTSSTTAQVTARYFENGFSAATYTLRFQLWKSQWRVASSRLEIRS